MGCLEFSFRRDLRTSGFEEESSKWSTEETSATALYHLATPPGGIKLMKEKMEKFMDTERDVYADEYQAKKNGYCERKLLTR